MSVPGELHDLVERFERDRASYRSGQYNEAQTRVDFINPMLGLLGWDVENRLGRPEAYRDVVYEDRVKVGGGTKAPDYGFYAGGRRRFFLEAKKPSVDIAGDVAPAVQLRRYAWSARLPLSVLTDFEEFAIYDCRAEPEKNDSATTARLEFFTYDRYAEEAVWDRISSIFSREAVLEGSLERYTEENRRRRGTETVDAAFLREIESWRSTLARDIASRNDLNTRQLNYAVQITIDRIIFLRMAEDRGIEPYGRLMALLNGGDTYRRLCEVFRDADDRYNSGLFHFRGERGRDEEPDRLTLAIEIDDGVLKGIIRGLYYPESPYEFSVLPVDVLGQVYEQFLGKVIRLEDNHTATVEEKPEVRKAGGVYYTPTYIVDYIVEKTVGKLLEGKRPGPRGGASRLKIVDPACGSGSFLIGAYQYLLDWHRDRYVEDGPEKWSKVLYEGPGGQHHLTIDEKKRILLNNIHGVDIDPQAVEVTKLSLLLKVLEGESEASLATQLRMFQERALPDLDDNIKCGNSLIGPDFYDNEQMMLLDEEDHYRINVFDWREAFPQIFQGDNPGFDAVIGNPPYIRIQALKEFAPVEVGHYKNQYRSAGKGNYDIYVVFVERGLELLNRDGRLGYILPHKFFNAKYGSPVRELISEGKHLAEVVHFGDEQIFVGAATYTALLFLDKIGREEFRFAKADDLVAWRVKREATEGEISVSNVTAEDWNFVVGRGAALFEKLRKMPLKLGDVAAIFVGLQTSADKLYVLEEIDKPEPELVRLRAEDDSEWLLEREILKPFLNDVTLSPYSRPRASHHLIFPYNIANSTVTLIPASEMSSRYPRAWEYLRSNEKKLRARESGKADSAVWYGYIYRKNLTLFETPKLIVQVISISGRYAFDEDELYFTGGGNGPYYGVRWASTDGDHSLHFLQGLLNSRLSDFYLHNISTTFRGGYWSYGKRFIEQIPIRTIDFSDPEDTVRHDRMVGLVERMLSLHERLAEARIERERMVIGHQISATDRQIDNLVYELYGLTDEEIRIVEGAK
jgi:type I restriction-modification system DNA methylase subunit/predicted type IV restriction endonuclease